MLKNYLKTTIRVLFKKKTFSFLNIAGLGIGIACASFIFLWVEDELNFNHHFAKRNQLYQIYENQTYEGQLSTFHATPGPMAGVLAREIPGIQNAARTGGESKAVFSLGSKAISETGSYVDSSLLSMLQIPFVYGSPSTAFTLLHSVVISESMARRFFGDKDPSGQTLRVNNDQDYTVSGVMKDQPKNSSFQFNWLSPIQNIDHKMPWMQVWNANWARCYVELDASANADAVNAKLKHFLKTKDNKNNTICFLFPMTDWNLRNSFTEGKQSGGRIIYVRLFSAIAWIILFIACINFMNLSTARAEQRAREVGVRKVMGAAKSRLIVQFIGEAMVVSFIAVALATVLIFLFLPAFNMLVEKQLGMLFSPLHIGYLLVICGLTGLVAGSYPAFYLSSFNPIAVLKGKKMHAGGGQSFLRQCLVVTQFSISLILIIGTVVIYRQIQHVKDRALGYDRNHLVYLEMQGKMNESFDKINHDLQQTGVVASASFSDYPVLQIWNNTDNYSWTGKDASKNVLITWENVNSPFISTMGIKLAAGRDFYPDAASDSGHVIINESLARQMGKEGHEGALITEGGVKKLLVVGIVKDFLYNTMYEPGAPLLLYNHPQGTSFLSIRIKPDQPLPAALAKMETALKMSSPGFPVELKFIEDDFNQLFNTETLTGKLTAVFSGLAIAISCLGLFGLAAYTAERRIREIGIRKLLGASTGGLVSLLTGDFLRLVIYSCIISFPIAWWALNKWLQQYAYRTTISWWIFALAAVLTLMVALFTVSFQAIRASVSNPVDNLRTE